MLVKCGSSINYLFFAIIAVVIIITIVIIFITSYRWRRLCYSNDFQKIMNTNAYKIIIQFHSDSSIDDKGFVANFTWGECKYKLTSCNYFIDLLNMLIVLSIDDCTLSNGGCEHTCIPASVANTTTRTCKCNKGFELSAEDGTSCKGSLICLV